MCCSVMSASVQWQATLATVAPKSKDCCRSSLVPNPGSSMIATFALLHRRYHGVDQLLVGDGGPSDVNGASSHAIAVTDFDDVDAGGIEGGRYLGGYLGRELLTDAVIPIAKRNIDKR